VYAKLGENREVWVSLVKLGGPRFCLQTLGDWGKNFVFQVQSIVYQA
jgi:hypothetical protein